MERKDKILAIGLPLIAAATGLIVKVKSQGGTVTEAAEDMVESFTSYVRLTDALRTKFVYYARKYNVPVQLVLAIAEKESGFNSNAINYKDSNWNTVLQAAQNDSGFAAVLNASPEKADHQAWGAYGLLQMKPQFFYKYGVTIQPGESNRILLNPDVNLDIGCDKLARLWNQYGNAADIRGIWTRNMTLQTAINCYNTGDCINYRKQESPKLLREIIGRFLTILKKHEATYGHIRWFANSSVESQWRQLCSFLNGVGCNIS
ncbi:MAG: transglycosylase SLT domain-containing protein [Melioribacteraceae bacterium]|jgi:hypothetical protein|nr:transglycosylase SLT domain-containing protein [Melioribacteraceae bacterium]